MRVLFISSGNSGEGISSIVKRQGQSLQKEGIDLYFFNIKGKGLLGYLGNRKRLALNIKQIHPDIMHAHYSKSAFLATLVKDCPLIVSLMGSDLNSSLVSKFLIRFLSKYAWNITIVKSEAMQIELKNSNSFVIPNGIDTKFFFPIPKEKCRDFLKWDFNKKYILFASNPNRKVKNFKLAQEAFMIMQNSHVELRTLSNVDPNYVPVYLNASDVILLTSLWEGSPNVIKEAMACNRPVVATDVGDIKWLFGDEQGYFLTSFEPKDIALKLESAVDFVSNFGYTMGRQRIIKLGLTAENIACKLIELYCKSLKLNAIN